MKLNIGYEISSEALAAVIAINDQVNRKCDGLIDFSDPNGPVPHITMAMGTVETAHAYGSLKHAVSILCKRLDPLPFTMLPAKWVRSGYLMSAVEPQDAFQRQRFSFAREAAPYMAFSNHGGPSSPVHVTLGLTSATAQALPPVEPSLPVHGVATSLCIFAVGLYGTCLEKLWQYDLPSDIATCLTEPAFDG